LDSQEYFEHRFPKDKRSTEAKLRFIKKLTLSQKALSELTRVDNVVVDEINEEDSQPNK